MIKVEKLTPDCIATINGGQRLLEGQLITRAELATIEVASGTITYSIDEGELVTQSATNTSTPIVETVVVETVVVEPVVVEPVVVEPVVVEPVVVESSTTDNIAVLDEILEEANTLIETKPMRVASKAKTK